jgi:glycopeptide antibiotics resistance protein
LRGIVPLQIQVNVIGFIPFGFFLSFWLIKGRQWASGHAFLGAIFIGISVSLSIELLQIYLPTRDSSMTELICNALGTILGVIVFNRITFLPISAQGRFG